MKIYIEYTIFKDPDGINNGDCKMFTDKPIEDVIEFIKQAYKWNDKKEQK